ncbi:MAG TPA: hypothetical protein VGL81_25040 [Polyangiaceae bacterium]|jgi:hypothetical protein
MTTPTVLVSTWRDGVFAFAGEAREQELAGQSVRALAPDGRGGALAIVDGHTLRRRRAGGSWSTLATAEADLACCVSVGDAIYIGTEDARLLRLGADGELAPLHGFGAVAGREKWYAGRALVDGRLIGPPLGIRSITATADGAALLANVHVGGIPRSTDGGATWQPTLEVDSDVHEVRAHPERPEIVMAAAAVGPCVSRDGGATWIVEREGLHATYCSAVAFAGDDVFLAASEDHFAPEGKLYRRSVDQDGPWIAMGAGLPEWLDGIADTGCIATNGAAAAVADGSGSVYVSVDAGHRWSHRAGGLPAPSSALIV